MQASRNEFMAKDDQNTHLLVFGYSDDGLCDMARCWAQWGPERLLSLVLGRLPQKSGQVCDRGIENKKEPEEAVATCSVWFEAHPREAQVGRTAGILCVPSRAQ